MICKKNLLLKITNDWFQLRKYLLQMVGFLGLQIVRRKKTKVLQGEKKETEEMKYENLMEKKYSNYHKDGPR